MKNLVYFRMLRKYSQSSFANEMGISRPKLKKWEEEGEMPTPEQIVKIAELLHVSIDSLFGRHTGGLDYRKEIQNLIFALNSQFNIILKNLEADDKICFHIGGLCVTIAPIEPKDDDQELPVEKNNDK